MKKSKVLVIVFTVLAASGCSDAATSTTTTQPPTTPTAATVMPNNSETRESEQRVYLALLDVQNSSDDEQWFWLDYGYATCDMLGLGGSAAILESSMKPLEEALIAVEAQGDEDLDLAPLTDGVDAVLGNANRIIAVASPGSLCPEYESEASQVVGGMLDLLDQTLAPLNEELKRLLESRTG